MPAAEKDDILARLMRGDGGALGAGLVQRMRSERSSVREVSAERRSVEALLQVRQQIADERLRIAAEKAAREKEQRERVAALARATHLKQLAGKEPMLWGKVENLIAVKQPKSYEQAVALLMDLRDLSTRKDEHGFRRQLEALRVTHKSKPALIARLDKAGL